MSHFYLQNITEDDTEIVIKPKKIDPRDVTLLALSLGSDADVDFDVEITAKQANGPTQSWLDRKV